jgi:chemotaxis protein MotB
MYKKIITILTVLFIPIYLTGCVGIKTNRTKDRAQEKIITNLNKELTNLNSELIEIQEQKKSEIQQLEQAQEELRYELEKEIKEKNAQVKINEKGLVITFLTQIFFSSGKVNIKKQGLETLNKIITPIKNINREIRIEGHTDNIPIKHMKYLYKSNWELSAKRAMSVLYFLEEKGINRNLLSAAGYGEHKPVAPNDTKENRAKNRRVEIVILPRKIKLVEATPNQKQPLIKEEKKEDSYIK